ncbi:MAG: CapA family protein [Synergistaceae bacterium]|jgi:poly-gamma-glutamate synthesis protein (capsule biosynthesis protein)|nr:CapA family protein [Synergistaceae bacterium]
MRRKIRPPRRFRAAKRNISRAKRINPFPANVAVLSVVFLVSFICAAFACWIFFDYKIAAADVRARRDALLSEPEITVSERPAPFFPPENEPKNEPAAADERYPIVLSFVGDCTLGQDINTSHSFKFSSVYEKNGPEYFLGAVKSIFESDDFTVANCEGALTDGETARYKPEDGPKYWFRGPPEYARVFSAGGVDAVNLANNHVMDFGAEGYEDTRDALAKAGVEFFGRDAVLVKEIRGLKIGFFGLSTSSGASLIKEKTDELKRQGARVIVASFHGGLTEISYVPTPSQIFAARAAVDNGAMVVVEHHPHVLQGIERYKNGVIAYSLGNFCFGGNVNPSDKDTMILQVEISEERGEIKCEYRAIPASVSSRKEYNDFRPRVLEGGEAARVEAKILGLSEKLVDGGAEEPSRQEPSGDV